MRNMRARFQAMRIKAVMVEVVRVFDKPILRRNVIAGRLYGLIRNETPGKIIKATVPSRSTFVSFIGAILASQGGEDTGRARAAPLINRHTTNINA